MPTFNFRYSEQGEDEKRIIERLGSRLLSQGTLIEMLLEKEVFSYGDISNLYPKPNEDGESVPNEIFDWIAIDYLDDSDLAKLDFANWPYISNDYGHWIGRKDFGSAWAIYFLPALANILYND